MVKISNLPTNDALGGSEVPIVNQSGTTKKVGSLNEVSARTKDYIEGDGVLNADTGGNHSGTVDGKAAANVSFKNENETITGTRQYNANVEGVYADFVNLKVNGNPVSAGGGNFWSADGTGIAPDSDLTKLPLEAINKIVASFANIVDLKIYDTSKDPDGGAWRYKTDDTSWHKVEGRFPSKVLGVELTNGVKLYNLDDPAAPLWMSFDNNSNDMMFDNNTTFTSLAFKNGKMYVSKTTYGVRIIDFIKDKGTVHVSGGIATYKGDISQRNDGLGWGGTIGTGIRDNAVHHMAIKIRKNAPIDAITGLPMETVIVGMNVGISQINPDGTVYDMGYSPVTKITHVSIDEDDVIHTGQDGDEALQFGPALTVDVANIGTWRAGFYNDTSVPALPINLQTTINEVMESNVLAAGQNGALTLIDESVSTVADRMVAYITTEYNTGWMPGDIKGAWLSSNDSANLSGSELVTNGTFDTDTDWTKGTGWSIAAGVASCDGTQTATSALSQGLTLTVGKEYSFTFTISNWSAGSIYVYCGSTILPSVSANGTYNVTFVAAASQILYLNAGSTFVGDIDNVTVVEADPDRSVNSTGLTVYGTITKSAVATGAELMAYSGFSSSNYLEQPYNSDLDFGTGDFLLCGWFDAGGSGDRTIIERTDPSASGALMGLYHLSANTVRLWLGTTGYDVSFTSTTTYTSGWHFAVAYRSGTSIKIFVDNIEVASGTNSYDLTNTSAKTRVGIAYAGASPANKLFLVRFSATAPTVDQIEKMYNDEKFLFQENAQSCLSNSDVVNALSYDEGTEKLMVGTNDGTDIFKVLQRVDYIDNSGTPTNDTINSVSMVDGAYAIGTGAEAVGYEPAKSVREELNGLKNKSAAPTEGVSAMTNVTTPANLNADTVTVAELADIVGNLIDKLQARGVVTQ